MKKALSILACAMLVPLLSAPAWADGDAAYSANAVGVVKYTIPAGGAIKCITWPLNPLETSDAQGRWVWGETSLAQQLDNQSTVYFWTGTGWESFTKTVKGKWPATVTNRPVIPGEAIFVRTPGTSTEDKTISLLGELPTEGTLSYSLRGSKNLDTRGVSMYPVEVIFGESELAASLDNQSTVYFWTGTGWESFTKTVKGKWPTTITNRVVGVGEGVFVRSIANAPSEVTITRPFEWEN